MARGRTPLGGTEAIASLPSAPTDPKASRSPPNRGGPGPRCVAVWSQTAGFGPEIMRNGTKRRKSVLRVVAEVRGEPALGLGGGPAFAVGVVGDLVGSEAADDEVLRLRVAEVDSRPRSPRRHRHRLGQLHP